MARKPKVITLKVNPEEFARLARYAMAYKGGGFQNLIRDILARNMRERK